MRNEHNRRVKKKEVEDLNVKPEKDVPFLPPFHDE